MNNRLSEINKVLTAVIPQAFTGAATTINSRGFSLSDARKALFRFRLGNVADTDLVYTFSVLEASDIAGATAQNVGGAAATPNFTLTTAADGCIPNANIVQLTMDTPTVADVITINGVEFTAAAAADLPNRVYDQSGNTTQQAASLTAAINLHLPRLVATSNVAVITIQSREPGAETITVTGITAVADVIPVTVEAVGYIEVDASAMSAGFNRLVARSLTGGVAAGSTLSVDVMLGDTRYKPPAQQAAGSAFS